MRCPKCEYDAVPEEARFCPNCGNELPEPKSPLPAIHVTQNVGSVQGGTVVGVQIDQFEASFERGEIIGEKNIYNITMDLGGELGEAFLDGIASRLMARQGLDGLKVDQLGSQPLPTEVSDQIQNVISAQKEAATAGVQASAETLHRLGTLAAYRRDYEEAMSYFRQAAQADPEYTPAWEAIMWLQQIRAKQDIKGRDYDAAESKLSEAREAANHTDPLDRRALTLRGYIAQTLAQIAQDRGSTAQCQEHLREAERFFDHVVRLDSQDAGAWNGLGNIQAMLEDHEAAIESYQKAIQLSPTYTAAYNDLGITYYKKMKADPDHADDWCRKTLWAWEKAFDLAQNDPGFSESDRLDIGSRVEWLKGQCDPAEEVSPSINK